MTAITGNTYPVREQLKALGGKWDPTRKAWMVTASKVEEARRIVREGTTRASYSPRSNRTYTYAKKRCHCCGSSDVDGVCNDCGAWNGQ